jgi:hypothetical protein
MCKAISGSLILNLNQICPRDLDFTNSDLVRLPISLPTKPVGLGLPSSEATSSWSTNCRKEESPYKKTRLHDKLNQQLRLWVYGRIERL